MNVNIIFIFFKNSKDEVHQLIESYCKERIIQIHDQTTKIIYFHLLKASSDKMKSLYRINKDTINQLVSPIDNKKTLFENQLQKLLQAKEHLSLVLKQ